MQWSVGATVLNVPRTQIRTCCICGRQKDTGGWHKIAVGIGAARQVARQILHAVEHDSVFRILLKGCAQFQHISIGVGDLLAGRDDCATLVADPSLQVKDFRRCVGFGAIHDRNIQCNFVGVNTRQGGGVL